MKWKSSSLVFISIWILGKLLKLNILLQFELWVYFKYLLNSMYRMTWNFCLHCDTLHYNIHLRWNFQIFKNNFLHDMIFLHFFSKKFQKIIFLSKRSKFLWCKERHVISSLKEFMYCTFRFYMGVYKVKQFGLQLCNNRPDISRVKKKDFLYNYLTLFMCLDLHKNSLKFNAMKSSMSFGLLALNFKYYKKNQFLDFFFCM